MIEKEKVLKVIDDFSAAKAEQNNIFVKKEQENFSLEKYQYGEKMKGLLNYLENLSCEEIIDLCALMDYGRKCKYKEISIPDIAMFRQIRKSFLENHREDKHLANYLLGKSELNIYLTYAAKLYCEGVEGF